MWSKELNTNCYFREADLDIPTLPPLPRGRVPCNQPSPNKSVPCVVSACCFVIKSRALHYNCNTLESNCPKFHVLPRMQGRDALSCMDKKIRWDSRKTDPWTNMTCGFILREGMTQEGALHHDRGGAQSDMCMRQRAPMIYNGHPTGSRFFLGGTSSTNIHLSGTAYILWKSVLFWVFSLLWKYTMTLATHVKKNI